MKNKEFINYLRNHPKSHVEVNNRAMVISIKFKDVFGRELSAEEMNEEIENAKFHLSVYRHYRHGLFIAWDFLQNYIKNIEIWEKSPSRRYQLLKYGISKLIEEYENIIDERTIDMFFYDFVKKGGKMSLETRPWSEEEALVKKVLRRYEMLDKHLNKLEE